MQCYRKYKKSYYLEYPGFWVICHTRWTLSVESKKSNLDNWFALQQIWEESLNGNYETELKGRVIGVKSHVDYFD